MTSFHRFTLIIYSGYLHSAQLSHKFINLHLSMLWAFYDLSFNQWISLLNIWLTWHRVKMDNIDIIFSFYFFTWCICTIISYIYSCVCCIDPGALLETWLWGWCGQVEHKIKCIVWWYTVYIYINMGREEGKQNMMQQQQKLKPVSEAVLCDCSGDRLRDGASNTVRNTNRSVWECVSGH